MSKIHYFQRYHQKENVLTNNTMLLFSRLYHQSPKKFEVFLSSLLDPAIEITIGVGFSQQERSKDSVPDGTIFQQSFKIAIETKRGNGFGENQLINHLQCFSNEHTQILIALSNVPMDSHQLESVQKKIEEFNKTNNKKIQFTALTFQEIINAFNEQLSDYDLELQDVIEDFTNFCDVEGMLPKDYPRMIIVPCGKSIKDNLEYKIYYDPATRNNSRATHMGIYKNKRVQAISKIVNVVEANYDFKTKVLEIISEENPTTEDQKNRIIGIITAAISTLGWSIENGHKFFCLDHMELTSFKKTSPGGIMGKRYENLEEKTGLTKDSTTKEFAEKLKNETWN